MRVAVTASLLLAGCTSRAVLEKVTTQKERDEIVQTAEAFCDPARFAALKPRFADDIWAESQGVIIKARQHCPKAKAPSRLIGYQFNVQTTNGVTTRAAEYTVVTESPGLWTKTTYSTLDNQITAWNLNGTTTMPEELAQLDAWDAMVPKLRIGLGLAVALLFGLIGFFVVRGLRAKNARPL